MAEQEERDDWPEFDLECECDQCGEVRPCCRMSDPYLNEIEQDEDHDEEYWCKECFDTRAGDI